VDTRPDRASGSGVRFPNQEQDRNDGKENQDGADRDSAQREHGFLRKLRGAESKNERLGKGFGEI
jgi:hypothetical protein